MDRDELLGKFFKAAHQPLSFCGLRAEAEELDVGQVRNAV